MRMLQSDRWPLGQKRMYWIHRAAKPKHTTRGGRLTSHVQAPAKEGVSIMDKKQEGVPSCDSPT